MKMCNLISETFYQLRASVDFGLSYLDSIAISMVNNKVGFTIIG